MNGRTSDRAYKKIGNRFELVIIAAKRARELSLGADPLIPGKYNPCVTAMMEIEQGLVGKEYLEKPDAISNKKPMKRK